MSLRHRLASVFLSNLGLLLGCGSGQVRETPPPVCVFARPTLEGQPIAEPSNADLVRLVLGSGARLGAVAPSADCGGDALTVRPNACEPRLSPLPRVPVGDAQLIARRVSSTEQLVWLIARSDGVEGEGPIALVEKRAQGMVVRAKGVLRAEIGRARPRLALEGSLLVVDSERCAGESPSTCERTAHLLVRRGVRFERVPVLDRQDHCLAGPSFAMSRTSIVALPDGWQRRFELAASWEERGHGIVIHETVTMRDTDPRTLSIPPRPFRVVSGDRIVRVDDGLVGDVGPLLERAMVQFGSVAASTAEE